MLTRRIIPCLDVRDGRVVKGVRFAGLRDAGDPVEQAARYQDHGADEMVMLDVSATLEGRRAALATIARLRAVLSIPLCVGGGVRTLADARAMLEEGADKVAVNSAAVASPDILSELASIVGSQCVVLSLDAASNTAVPSSWEVVTHSGSRRTGLDALRWAQQAEALGAGEILLTSFDRDGSRSGYDLPLIGAMAHAVRLPIIASGGAGSADDMRDALAAGADAVLAASIFHDGLLMVRDIKQHLAAAGMEIRSADPLD
jgi:imidazoleglycerol phosphate synthase cyclase subunit